jgi:hypothetical protein
VVSFTLDLTGDWAVWDGLESVTYRSVANTGDADYEVSDALRADLTFRELAASGGVYTTQDRKWLVPQSLLTPTPKPADLLIDGDDVQWTVLAVGRDNLQKVWELTCRDLVLAAALYDLVTVERVTYAQDDAGGRTYGEWTAVYTDIPARIQEGASETVDERGKRITRQSYVVYLAQRVTVTIEDRLKGPDGLIYEIRGSSNPDRIDELMQLQCERRA